MAANTMRASTWFLVPVTLLGLACLAVAAESAQPTAQRWDLERLGQAPKTYSAPGLEVPEVRALFYDGPICEGKPTRVFAYYGAPKAEPGKRLPAMVLVHGGGGTAFDRWVRLWNQRGYAAIAMDLCGCVPVRDTAKKWKHHEHGGPPGWGGFDQIDWPAHDQWTYQAIADILLAHSLIRSFPEVDPQRIGVTGISWGGYLTSLVSGVDSRFRFAVPVYGCGYLGDNSAWLANFERMTPDQRARWLGWWDPSVYLRHTTMPVLWVNGTNDFAYPMDSWQKSYRTPQGPHTLCLRLRMPHGHGPAGENPPEIHAFAESTLRAGAALAKVTSQGRRGDQAWASYESATPIVRAELNYTRDEGRWQQRKWEAAPAELAPAARRATARLPQGVKVFYLNLIDSRGLIVSSEHELVSGAVNTP
jgi:dienelactone hydrolase